MPMLMIVPRLSPHAAAPTPRYSPPLPAPPPPPPPPPPSFGSLEPGSWLWRASGAAGQFAMLGLGDIVLPALAIAFARRMDLSRRRDSHRHADDAGQRAGAGSPAADRHVRGRSRPGASTILRGWLGALGDGGYYSWAVGGYALGLATTLAANTYGWTINDVSAATHTTTDRRADATAAAAWDGHTWSRRARAIRLRPMPADLRPSSAGEGAACAALSRPRRPPPPPSSRRPPSRDECHLVGHRITQPPPGSPRPWRGCCGRRGRRPRCVDRLAAAAPRLRWVLLRLQAHVMRAARVYAVSLLRPAAPGATRRDANCTKCSRGARPATDFGPTRRA